MKSPEEYFDDSNLYFTTPIVDQFQELINTFATIQKDAYNQGVKDMADVVNKKLDALDNYINNICKPR